MSAKSAVAKLSTGDNATALILLVEVGVTLKAARRKVHKMPSLHMRCVLYCIAIFTAITPTSVGQASSVDFLSQESSEPGNGVLCTWTLLFLASNVGRRCPGKYDEAFQIPLDRGVADLDRYVLENSSWSTERLAQFKGNQIGQLNYTGGECSVATISMFEAIRLKGMPAIRRNIEQAIARPGVPTWGRCL